MRLWLILALLAQTATAQEAPGKPMTAAEFDAATRGLRMDTTMGGQIYGVEEFLPGQRSVWRDSSGCKKGTWEQVGDQICFAYEDDPTHPDCWIYVQKPDGIYAWYEGVMENPAIKLTPGNSPMTCDFLGV